MFLPLANLEGPLPWLVVGMALLLIFGNRLPSLARSLGTSVKEFKKGTREGEEDGVPPAPPAVAQTAEKTEKK